MLEASERPLGTVPVYETVSRLDGDIPRMNPDFLLEVIRAQAEQGVDFMTLHAGLLRKHIPLAMKRKMGIVSRGGAMSDARAQFDWDKQFALCLDPERAKARWLKTRSFMDEAHSDDHCSMCGKQFCAVRTSRRIRELAKRE